MNAHKRKSHSIVTDGHLCWRPFIVSIAVISVIYEQNHRRHTNMTEANSARGAHDKQKQQHIFQALRLRAYHVIVKDKHWPTNRVHTHRRSLPQPSSAAAMAAAATAAFTYIYSWAPSVTDQPPAPQTASVSFEPPCVCVKRERARRAPCVCVCVIVPLYSCDDWHVIPSHEAIEPIQTIYTYNHTIRRLFFLPVLFRPRRRIYILFSLHRCCCWVRCVLLLYLLNPVFRQPTRAFIYRVIPFTMDDCSFVRDYSLVCLQLRFHSMCIGAMRVSVGAVRWPW